MKTKSLEEQYGSLGIGNNIQQKIAEIKARQKRRVQRRNHIIFWVIVFTAVAAIFSRVTAQNRQFSVMVGEKAVEVSMSYTAENELMFGLSASITDSKVTQDRANKNDRGRIHDFKGDVTPAAFALLGAKFDNLHIIGKLGVSYVEQNLDNKHMADYYFAAGLAVEYKISDTIGLRGSYDSVSGAMAGVTLYR